MLTHNTSNRKFKFIKISVELVSLTNLIDYVIKEYRDELPEYLSLNVQIEGESEGEVKEFFTIGERYPVQITDQTSIDACTDYLLSEYDKLSDLYKTPIYINYYVNYISLNVSEFKNKSERVNNVSVKVEIPLGKETPLNLPLNTQYRTWGNFIELDSEGNLIIKDVITHSIYNKNRITSIRVKFTGSKSRTIELISNNTVVLSIFDQIISENEFIRSFDNKEFHIKNNVPYFFFERKFAHKNITPLKINKEFDLEFMTLDIETYTDSENILHVYCISYYDGIESKSFFVADYTDLDSMLNALFKSLFTRTNNGKLIFIHNSSMFDLIFLLKPLLNYPNITLKPTLKEGKFINLSIKYGQNGIYQMALRDSILMLPSSLSKLCSAFDVEKPKDIFPHNFVKADNLDYIGNVPAYKYFDNTKVSLDAYNAYANRFINQSWSLKAEAIKYCELDCTSLHNVISNFAVQIFETFNINISKCPTLPSLAFRIFRTQYMDKNLKLPVLVNQTFKDISKSYFGGHVDMYIPANKEGETLYWYDVNALYPSEMAHKKYPVSLLGHFKGDITKKLEFNSIFTKNVGFYKVNLVAPSIEHPILPIKSSEGRTIFPEGPMTGWYYSEELKNAEKYGYKYTILEGYIFSSKNIFDKFVFKLSEMKENADKNSATYLIAKLLMNSLYGKFGMKPIYIEHAYIDNNKIDQTLDKIGIDNIIMVLQIGDKALLSYKTTFESKYVKINVAIASAVTANARIHMSQFKNNPDFKLYYSDTDSILIDKPLSSELVHNKKLGLMKLEKVLNRFVSLGPKVYGGETTEGNQFIKVKGLKNPPTLDELESKLDINSPKLEINHEKWSRSIKEGHIQIENLPYTIKVTSNKRVPVYNEQGILCDTKNIKMLAEPIEP